MVLELYYNKQKSDKGKVDTVFALLNKLKKIGKEIKIVDVSNMPNDKKFELYSKAWTPSVFKKYKIRKVFGTHRNPGCLFGEIPALFVYEKGENYPSDVFPHDRHGKIETIEDYLNKL